MHDTGKPAQSPMARVPLGRRVRSREPRYLDWTMFLAFSLAMLAATATAAAIYFATRLTACVAGAI
ncbi:hypothetical protein [uncultured Thiodictyon sp.]|uniref:hypothetical protein n=1 Tax=uncultured Thiodictyon sp. TaxID=1846217 RepID=UPI0025EE1205|nr:hypothetical protein [uncultured Thiodictyon sp.]